MERHNNDDDDDDDDSERPAAAPETGGERPAIHQCQTQLQATSCTMALVSLLGAKPFPSSPRQRFTLSGGDDDKRLTVTTVKNAIDRKSWLTLTG